MLTVTVYVNHRPVVTVGAVRRGGKPGKLCVYELSTGTHIMHDYDAGAAALGAAMLAEFDKQTGTWRDLVVKELQTLASDSSSDDGGQ